MDLYSCVDLEKYSRAASDQFDELEDMLSGIEDSLDIRMNGKKRIGLIISILGTILWFVAAMIFYWYMREHANSIPYIVCASLSFALLTVLLIDEIISISYYGRILKHKITVTGLIRRVNIGRDSILSSQTVYKEARSRGWSHSFDISTSIPEEARRVENTLRNMESLKKGFINGLKNCLFFASAIAFTLIGSWALYKTGDANLSSISNESVKEVLNYIFTITSLVGEILLAKMIWKETNSNVTNITIISTVFGPLLFMAQTIVTGVVIALVLAAVNGIISIIKALIPVILVIGVLASLVSGASGG